MNSAVVTILQGRVRSTRLPAKGFLPFFGQTVWERLCDIGLSIRGCEQVIFATGDKPENQLARPLVESKGIGFFVGNEDNVLERFAMAAEDSDAEFVVRLTCDNYLIQPDLVEDLVSAVCESKADYGYIHPLSHYCGEVIRRQTLINFWRTGSPSALACEHVTWDLRSDPTISKVILPGNYLGIDHENSVTLDDFDDFIRMKTLERDCPELKSLRCVERLRTIV
jgi:spore coat polysaccharide biosynthesis protein SpsF (cytidylyltransferase family)